MASTSQYYRKKALHLVAMSALVVACVTTSQRVHFNLDLTSANSVSQRPFRDQSESLAQVLKTKSDREALQDVSLMLEALSAEERQENELAMSSWRQALPYAKGAFGERAFRGWLKSFVKAKATKFEKSQLARMIFDETSGGNASPWMIEKDLVSSQKISDYIVGVVPEAIQSTQTTSEGLIAAPDRAGIPAGDPLLTATAREICRNKSKLAPGWTEWRQTMNKEALRYFDALVAQCSGQAAKASEEFLNVAPRLGSSDATAHLALECYSRAIKIKRDAGERDSVAPLFLPLMRLWKNRVITETTLGLTRQAFETRRIDDALAAARHLGLIGDTDSARSFANEAIDLAMSAQSQAWAMTSDMKTALAVDMAESYHFQAFRLALETKDWARASALTKTALQLDGLNQEWLLRLQWSSGLYEYLAGDFEAARRSWEQMLSDKSDEAYRPMLLFWISRCHAKLGHPSETAFYRKTLAQDHPLSFYSVVGLSHDVEEMRFEWTKPFGDFHALRDKLSNWQDQDISSLRNHPERSVLLRRAELLAEAKTTSFLSMAFEDLQRLVDPAAIDEAEQRAAVYITRLLAANGYWIGSQGLTTKLAKSPLFWEKYPEQLLVYFPRPWLSLYQRNSLESGVETEALLAITRQESGFRFDARSPANAFGLMQFTPATARRISQQFSFDVGKIPDSLLDPAKSIQLGAYYVKLLDNHFSHRLSSVFAAYNAGEQAAESWAQKRMLDPNDEILFIELIPYLETKSYVKNVWRNQLVYSYLATYDRNSELQAFIQNMKIVTIRDILN